MANQLARRLSERWCYLLEYLGKVSLYSVLNRVEMMMITFLQEKVFRVGLEGRRVEIWRVWFKGSQDEQEDVGIR